MDVHRSRFVPYPTSPITSIAFSRPSDSHLPSPPPPLKLALGRANGSIEIWDPAKGLWNQEAIFPGDGKSVDGLVWTQDPNEKAADGGVIVGQLRLFGIGSKPEVVEWDLGSGGVKRRSTGNFGDVWCLAAQPRHVGGQKKDGEEERAVDLVAGCSDGSVVVLSTAEEDLTFKRFLARVGGKKARCMSIVWKNRDVVIAGFADSMIRVYDTRNAQLVRSMSLGAGIAKAPKDAMVWQVRALLNGDIVSADSNGEIKIWDGKTYSLAQTVTAHDADCLDLIVSNDGKTMVSGGLDGKVAMYRQSIQGNGRRSWAKSQHRRTHTGEVKAMASFDSKLLSIVVSGGTDATPMVTPLREYGKENLRGLSSLPSHAPVVSAPKARLLVCWWGKEISIWRISRQNALEALPEQQRSRRLVAKISLDTRDSLTDVAISPDGRLLGAATHSEVKAFQLRKRLDSKGLGVRKLAVPEDMADSGARRLQISSDGLWLAAVTPESEIQVVRITNDADNPKQLTILDNVVELDRQRRRQTKPSATKVYERSTNTLTFNPDSSILVAGDLSGFLDSWVLEGHLDPTAPALDLATHDSDKNSSIAASSKSDSSDSDDDDESSPIFHGQHWAPNPSGHLLPKLDSGSLILTFRPEPRASLPNGTVNGNPGVHSTRNNPHAHSHELPRGPQRLLVLTAAHKIYELDILAGKFTDWSRRNTASTLPEEFTKIRERAMGCVWDVNDTGRERVWLYGSTWVFMLDVGRDFAALASLEGSKKRRASELGGEEDSAETRKRLKGSGAGSRVLAWQVGDSVQRTIKGETQTLELTRKANSEDDDMVMDYDEEDEVEVSGEELRVSRLTNGETETKIEEGSGAKRWWSTFKYRPILGMVPLEDEGRSGAEGVLEVVIVERVAQRDEMKR
ncbi:hypothetical protein B0A48_18050 [Cryoendolithus antarcticus]|uniref:Uncharacterized protein n=1 Tax=Cryoendolithus antarcticus TaxID=1507870 RepID=A0A1V8SAF8_9PEZI|nr:hypothetical protein B0A48_18050 [Cryoendolithus antarcticus]